MGLLDLLLQGKTSLDVEVPSPNGGPINVPANNFIQNYLPDKSYLDSTQGKPNNGSELADTLADTSLDNTDIASTTSTMSPSPDLTTQYTQYNTGEFGEAAETFTPKWSQDKPYISNYNPNVQTRTLNETGLDVEASNAIPTAANPDNETNYPELSRGEFGGSSNQYTQIYTPNSTYLSNINLNTQPQTLNETGLDVENPNAAPTTQLPNNYTPYPQYVQGEFNGATSQYTQTYTPSNPYMGNINFISGNETNAQVNSLFSTGLDTEAEDAAPTTTIPSISTEYPYLTTGVWGLNANQFYQGYNQDNTYSDIIGDGYQQYSLSNTSLDGILTDSISTTPTPDSISSPTFYPSLAKGKWGLNALNFTQPYGPGTDDYLENYNDNTLIDTLIDTSLDVENTPVNGGEDPISTIPTPNEISSPTWYGNVAQSLSVFQIKMGVLGGGPFDFVQNWYPKLGWRYIDNLNQYFNTNQNPLVTKVTGDNGTGLDVENDNAANTTFVNDFWADPTTYPFLVKGKWNGNPHLFYQSNTPSYTYINNVNDDQVQIYTLDNTGLDIENPNSNSTVFVPNDITDPTIYPFTATGDWGWVSNKFTPIWKPNIPYYYNIGTGNLKYSGFISSLNIGDTNSTSYAPNPNNNSTNYWYSTYTARGKYNSPAASYVQQWNPDNNYYNLSNPNNWDKLRIELTTPSIIALDEGGSGLDLQNVDYNPLVNAIPGGGNIFDQTTEYPFINSSQIYWGKFQGPPEQFIHPNRPDYNQYYNNSNYFELINVDTNPQVNTLGETGLNIGDNMSAPTSFTPSDPTLFPYINSVNLGEFNGAPSLHNQNYTPNKYYLFPSNLSSIISLENNIQVKSLDTSSLDIPLTEVIVDTTTNYPIISSTQILTPVNLGEFGFGPDNFQQDYTPNNTYLTSLNGSIQINSLYNSGLDIEDSASNAFTPPIPDTVTVYPNQQYVHLDGVANDFYPLIDTNFNPNSQYTQRWKPAQTYYSYMKDRGFAASAA